MYALRGSYLPIFIFIRSVVLEKLQLYLIKWIVENRYFIYSYFNFYHRLHNCCDSGSMVWGERGGGAAAQTPPGQGVLRSSGPAGLLQPHAQPGRKQVLFPVY